MTKKTNNEFRMIKETIKTNTDLMELFSGSLVKIQQGLRDIEDTFGDVYENIEVKMEYNDYYDQHELEIHLYGYRPETPKEQVLRLEREEKARIKRLEQLEKDKKALQKKKEEIEKKLEKMGAKP